MGNSDTFPIVGIGASAGGIEALKGFFQGLPPPTPGVAIVIVTHLSPERESLLHEVVHNFTVLPVHVIEDDMRIEIDHVYVLPADAILGIKNRRLILRKSSGQRERKPIDIFFSELAADIGDHAAGVVLSGGDGDGTLGIKAIKEQGGLTMAQVGDGFGPQHPSMPEAAIATGLVDFAVPADQMGAKLVEFVHSSTLLDQIIGEADTDEKQSFDKALAEVYAILRNQVGHDFSGYKTKSFTRRVQRRLQVTQIDTIDAYLERLRQDPQEVSALFRDLLIGVTNFFRDEDAFNGLAATVIPALFDGRGAGDTVRIWVPGCSTGEEVYSIAMLAREHMDRLTALPHVQIFATDIDERALSVARAARYPEALLDGLSPERRERFFIPDGSSFVVSKDVRELCIFSPHSVLRDPPFSRIDLVSCRNLLIYFGTDVQHQVIPIFHYALRPEGYLFLGSAENVSQFDDLFAPIDKRLRIFRRRPDVVPRIRMPIAPNSGRPGNVADLIPKRPPFNPSALRQAADSQVLERFAPPYVVINRDGEVIYYSHRTGKYLESPAGAPTRQILIMARKGLRLDLRTVFHECVESGRTATRAGVPIEDDEGRVQMIDLTVEPLNGGTTGETLFLVLFFDRGPVLNREEALHHPNIGTDTAIQVERELRETRERLKSSIEEYETTLEELKSSNEELVSVNEEMQSSNEELEASKEELQSVNEELHTVNTELIGKIEALDRANSDLLNLFESTDVATIFLDENLLIRSFTPAVATVFNILPSDRGRPITDLSSRLALGDFTDDVAAVFKGAAAIERSVENADHSAHFLVRLAPYRDSERETQGVVVSFIDVTSLAHIESQRLLIAELQHRTRNLLAVVHAIAQRTLPKGKALDEYLTRLTALGRVQNFVGGPIDTYVDLGDIIRLEFEAMGALAGKASISGPNVPLAFTQIQTMALVIHELATNAIKYGALREGSGRLTVSWEIQNRGADARFLSLTWRESGVADISQIPGRGFGRELIERSLPYSARARSEFTFGSDGVICKIELPLSPAAASKSAI
jgi:two-component system CheB/CheR fusion protein